MTQPVIKGEVHTSRGDLEEERDILAEGVDTLVIEGQEGEADYGWLHGWFGIAMMIFEYLFARFLYTDNRILIDIAKGQNADIVYTRASDAELIDNSHGVVVVIAFALFYLSIFASVVYGVVLGSKVGGAMWLLISGLGPILLLRLHETWKTEDNRDEKIAQKIEDAVDGGGRVVAVMGQRHAETVPDHLPEEIDPDVRVPEYGFVSLPMARDLAAPVVRLCGTLSMVYPVFLAFVDLYLSFI